MTCKMIQDSEELATFGNLIQFLSVKASAGSGKTHNLAKRYIELLKLFSPTSLGSIIAITFTNKASAEMKERIITFLKGLANIGENKLKELKINPEEAKQLLLNILKNFDDFNVTTIDSFMNTLHKALAVDLGVYPDYDITFNSDDIYTKAIDLLLQDSNYLNNILNFLETQLRLQQNGLNGEEIIEKGLKNYYKKSFEGVISYSDLEKIAINNLNLENTDAKDMISFLKERIRELSSGQQNSLNSLIEDAQNKPLFNGNKIRSYKDIDLYKLEKSYTDYKKLVDSKDLSDLLKKNCVLQPNVEKKFLEILNDILKIYRHYLSLRYVKETENVIKILDFVMKKEEELKQSLNIVDGSDLARRIKEELNKENGVTYAFCKLGERIKHYLIDEFQDTSREQFDAIYPLLDNSHSQDGTIFVVGDKKQSIYGWRGGDYTIFDEIEEKFSFVNETLITNYRSGKNIVYFNNICFSNAHEKLIHNLFTSDKDNIDEFKQSIINEIVKVYENSSQEVDKEKVKYDGYINIHLKPDTEDNDIEDFYKKRLFGLLRNLLKERGYNYSDIMILVRNNDEIVDVVDWLYNSAEFNSIPFVTDGNLRIMNSFDIKKILLVASYFLNKGDEFYENSLNELNLSDITEKYPELDYADYSPYDFFCKIIEILNIKNDIYIRRFLEEVHRLISKNMNTRGIVDYFYNNKDISISSPDEVNAIKIMSIHKSKGLQSKVVILPCFDWDLYRKETIYDYIPLSECIDNYHGDKHIFVPINKFVDISNEAKDKYNNKLKSQIIEGINLMYVAMTRAERELFITGSIKLTKTKDYRKPIQASAILRDLLLEMKNCQSKLSFTLEDNDDKSLFFVCGEMQYIEKKENQDALKDRAEKVYSPDLIINRIKHSFIEEVDVENVKEGQRVGDIIHKILSFITVIENEESISSEIDKGFYYANIPIDETIKERIIKTINDLKDYFIGIDACWTEKEFVTKGGAIFRIDRLVKKGGEYIVIDYKTGNPKDEDINQVKSYLKLIPNSKGLIYYLNGEGVKYV